MVCIYERCVWLLCENMGKSEKQLGDCWNNAGKRGWFRPGRSLRDGEKGMHSGFIWEMEFCKTKKVNERYWKYVEKNLLGLCLEQLCGLFHISLRDGI